MKMHTTLSMTLLDLPLHRLSKDLIAELCLVIPPTFLFPKPNALLVQVCPQIVEVLDPAISKHRWKVVNYYTTVSHGIHWGVQYTEWRLNGQLHRDKDQPARIWANGEREWYIHGKRHRESDQPAHIGANGDKEWWINGNKVK